MSERYTDHARMVMAFAKKEPLCFKSSYIGTEHYLLAVLQVKEGAAFRILASLNLDLADLAAAVERKCEQGLGDEGWGELPQTPRAKRVVQLALEEARAVGSVWVTTGHFLLALLREEEGAASDVLKDFGVRLEQVRELLPQFTEESYDERAAGARNKTRAALGRPVKASDDIPPFDLLDLGKEGREALDTLQTELKAANHVDALQKSVELVQALKAMKKIID